MTVQVHIDRAKIATFCRRWKIVEFSLFGSALRDDFGPDSDVDVLVSYADDARRGLSDLSRMENELKAIFGRDVDLVDRRAVERSENYIRRRHVLEHLETIHAEG